MKKWYIIFIVSSTLAEKIENPLVDYSYKKHSVNAYINRRKNAIAHNNRRIAPWLAGVIEDAGLLHYNLFSFETAALLAGIVPAVIATRTFDNKIHSCFYETSCHKNKCQLPAWITELARVINGPTIAILGIKGLFFSQDDQDFALTARAMLISIPFLIYVNQAIKKLECNLSLRPWNEHFSKEKQGSGGFPSGHVSKATYLAVLFGMRFGYKFAIPLSLFAVFTGAAFVISNRHYTSQVVAGVGFGAAYALAASKVVDMHLFKNKEIALDLSVNKYGGPALQVSYRF